MIYHKERLQLRKVPNLVFFIDDSLDYIEKLTMLWLIEITQLKIGILEKRKLI
jgi:ribosome-binding factor A